MYHDCFVLSYAEKKEDVAFSEKLPRRHKKETRRRGFLILLIGPAVAKLIDLIGETGQILIAEAAALFNNSRKPPARRNQPVENGVVAALFGAPGLKTHPVPRFQAGAG